MLELQQYVDQRGRNAFEEWYRNLDHQTRSRVAVTIDRLRQGNSAAKGVGGGVLELRMNFGPGYRVYFAKDGDRLVILLCGGSKQRQHLDIASAQQLWREYKQHKKEQGCRSRNSAIRYEKTSRQAKGSAKRSSAKLSAA